MGFLKRLPSFNKRNRNKIAERSPVPTSLDALKENVKTDLPLSVAPLGETTDMYAKSTDSNTTPSNSFGLFDDIFAELNQTSPTRDSLQADISLSFALSRQLQMESTSNQQQQQAGELLSSSAANPTIPSGLFGQDSIYSRYATKTQQHHNTQSYTISPSTSNAGIASSPSSPSLPSHINTLSKSNDDENKNEQEVMTQMVLDSDISGSDDGDEDDDEESGSEDELWSTQQQQRERKLESDSPVMERLPNDHRLNTNRHATQHRNTVMESNQTMLNLMKNRHRQQVKLQNCCSQSQSIMRPVSPMHYGTPSPHPASSAMIVSPHLQRNSPVTTLTRSSSATSVYRQHGKPWITDYSPSRPSPLAPLRSLRSQPSTTKTSTSTTTSLHSTFTMSKDDETTGTGEGSDDHEDADDEADHATHQQHRLATINTKKHVPTVHHSSSVPDLKKKKRQGTYSPPSSQTLISDQQSTVSLSSSSSSYASTTNTSVSHTPSPTPLQRHLFSSIPTQRLDGFPMHRMRTMTSEPNLKQFASMPQHHHQQQMYQAPINSYNQLFYNQQQQHHFQQQRQRLQLEWEMMQLYQREQQLKQEYMLLQQRSFSPMHKSSTLPSLSTAYQDPRFYYTSFSSSLGPGLH